MGMCPLCPNLYVTEPNFIAYGDEDEVFARLAENVHEMNISGAV